MFVPSGRQFRKAQKQIMLHLGNYVGIRSRENRDNDLDVELSEANDRRNMMSTMTKNTHWPNVIGVVYPIVRSNVVP